MSGSAPAANILARDEVYCRNMAALFRSDLRLAQRIDECADDKSVVIEQTKTGAPTVAVRLPDSERPFYLHSRINPEAEAKRWADSVEIGDSLCYIINGFGLGYHVRALFARLKGEAFIIVTEPSLPLLKAAMETMDLADLFRSDRCIILTSTDKNEVQTRLEPHNTAMMMGAQFVHHAPSERIAPDFQAGMRKLLTDHMTYCRMSLVTLVTNSRITCRNIANNLPRFLATPPIDVLRGRFAGYPAIVVSAGPSLRRNIDQLAALKGKAVIIAVHAIYKTLLDRNIIPDFVTVLDYHELTKRFFEGVQDFTGTHMVAEPKVNWGVLDLYKGPVSILSNSFATAVLGRNLAARDGLKAGATVAHLSLYLAVYMGCDPIVFVGQDLGCTDHVYYLPGVAIHDLWRPELNRFYSIEMKEWERIVRARPILIKTKDIHGNDIYTDEQLFTYLQQFEGDFAALPPGRVIDATEGGVRKAGTTVMKLSEMAERYCTRSIPPEKFDYLRKLNWNDRSRLSAGKAEIEKRLRDIDELRRTCDRMLAVLKELTRLLDRPTEFNRRIAEVDALRVRMRQLVKTYEIVSAVSQHAELQRFSTDRRIAMSEHDDVSRARSQLRRDIQFVEAIVEGAGVAREILSEALSRFDAATGKE
ncbi:MAG: motility associated factor glycosyltransferase family protein [Phycisphaerae bacterium]